MGKPLDSVPELKPEQTISDLRNLGFNTTHFFQVKQPQFFYDTNEARILDFETIEEMAAYKSTNILEPFVCQSAMVTDKIIQKLNESDLVAWLPCTQPPTGNMIRFCIID